MSATANGGEPSLEFIPPDQLVGPGQYELVRGSADSIVYDTSGLEEWYPMVATDSLPVLLPGVKHWGSYNITHKDGSSSRVPVVTFLYHKIKDGHFEKDPRVVVWLGTGEGEHPDHAGQPPAVYLVGPHIGNIDPLTKSFKPLYAQGDEIESKHFSFASITGASEDGLILANPDYTAT